MGSNASKTIHEVTAYPRNLDVIDNSSDPRSPTPEISRTPLNGKTNDKRPITKNIDLSKTLEDANYDEKIGNSILSAVIKNHLQTFDPRSPTQDFERTPIVIAAKGGEPNFKEKLNLKPCAKNFNLSYDEGDNDSYNSYEGVNSSHDMLETSLEHLQQDKSHSLGSPTVSEEKIEPINAPETSSSTGLLETNFEYYESQEMVDHAPLNIKKLTDKLIVLKKDPRSPSVDVERTPIVVPKIDDDSLEENVEDMSDDKLIKALQNTTLELRQTQANNAEGLLIYEDEGANVSTSPVRTKIANNGGCRTPLSCVRNKGDSGSHMRSKSANTLNDSSQKFVQTKLAKKVSRIPRLKERLSGGSLSLKGINAINSTPGDCENTPPTSHRDCWAQDTSIVL